MVAATAVKHAHHLYNKEITISNQIYGILCPRTNVCSTAGKPARHGRVAADSKGGRRIENRDTTKNLTGGDATITTKGQRPEMAKTRKPTKRHRGRSREGRGRTPTRRGSACGLTSRLNRLGTLDKV